MPHDDAGPDRAGEDHAVFAVDDDGEAGLEAQRLIGANANIAARDTLAGEAHCVLRRRGFADGDRTVEAVGFVAAVEAGNADEGHAQRRSCGAIQVRHDLPRENVADRREGGLGVSVHGGNSVERAAEASLPPSNPSRPNRPVSHSRRRQRRHGVHGKSAPP
ncbi:hypothetical protein [Brucella sp. NBRC 14130]|uniref:hypothetical protein n=1 Tax=Brucella sp. NBRC 14130 TaxID=3075483 RepID=UPI0033401221